MAKLYTEDVNEAVAEIKVVDDVATFVDLSTGEETVLAITKDGICYNLPKGNVANRQWANIKLVAKVIAEFGRFLIPVAGTRAAAGPRVRKDPNEKLKPAMKELGTLEEYEAIMAEAWADYDAKYGKKSEVDKKKDKLAKLQAEIAAMMADLGDLSEEEIAELNA